MRTRLVSYPPFGSTKTPLPDPLQHTITTPLGELPTGSIHYPLSGVNANKITGTAEVAFEYWSGTAWVEPPNCRFIPMNGDFNHIEDVPTRSYKLLGIGWLLRQAKVWEAGTLPVDKDGKVQFLSANAGTIMSTLITNAKGRGWGSGVTTDFSATTDSSGAAWASVITIAFDLELSLEAILNNLYQQGLADYRWEGRNLRIFNPDTTMARELPTVRLSVADNQTSAPEQWTDEDRLTDALVIGDDGKRWTFNNGATGGFGRLERVTTQSGVTDPGTAELLASRDLLAGLATRTSYTREFILNEATTNRPFANYLPGDWIMAQRGTVFERLRVVSVSVTTGKDQTTGHAVLGDRLDDILAKLAKRTSGITGGASAGGSGGRPAPEGPDPRKPAAPSGLVVSTTAYTTPDGFPGGRVQADWAHNGKATNGTTQEPDHYQLQRRINTVGSAWTTVSSTPDKSIAVGGVPIFKADGVTPESYSHRVRAVSEAGIISEWSAETIVSMATDNTPPPVPYFQPTDVTTWLRTVSVRWNGKGTTTGTNQINMPADFDHVNVYQNTSAAAAGRTLVGRIEAGLWPSGTMAAGVTVWYTLTSVDRSGNESEHSDARSITPQANVNLSDLTAQIDAATLQIINIGSSSISTGAILESKLADNAVSLLKLKDGAVSLLKLNTEVNDKITKGINDAATAQGKANTADTNAGKAQAAADKALIEAKKNNLILGGDFEDPDSIYGTAYRVPLASAHSGGYGAGLLSDIWRTIYWNTVPVIEGQLLEARCWVKDDGDTGNCKVSFAFDKYGPDGVELTGDLYPATIISDPLPNSVWQEAVVRFDAIPAGVSFVRLRTTSSGTVWGTAKVYIDDVWMGDVAAMAAAEAAQAKADQAFSDAAGALTAAGNAQTSANGKNNVYYLAALPSGSGFANGDTVFIRSAVGQPITAQHTWEKTGPTTGSWKLETLSHQVIASVDLGKATVGELDGVYVKARSLEADRLVIARGANLFTDPEVKDLSTWSAGYASATGGKSGKGSVVIPMNALQSGSYYATLSANNARRTKLVAGGTYRIGGWVKTSAAAPAASLKLYLRVYDDAQSNFIAADVPGNAPQNAAATVADTWTYVSGMVTIPLTETRLNGVLGAFKQTTYTTGTTVWSDFTIQQAMAGELVVDGSVTAGKMTIAGDPNNPAEVSLTANFAKLMKLEVSNLIATTGNMGTATIDKLWNDVVRSRKIIADMVVVGMGENAIVDPYLLDTATNALKMAGSATSWSIFDGGAEGKLFRHAFTGTGTPYVDMAPDWINVEPGKRYRFAYSMGGVSVTGNTPSLQATVAYEKIDGTTTYITWPGSVPGTNASGWESIEQELLVPVDVVRVKPRVRANSSGVGIVYIRHAQFARKADASLIVDGGVAARHLTVTEEMWANIIRFKKLEGNEIDANALSSDVAWIGVLRGGVLINDSVDTTILKADAITSKHTITGATLQTIATANRGVKITSTGIKAWTAGGSLTFDLVSSTGALSVFGGTLTGATIQTIATANRGIKLDATGMKAYSSTGVLKFILDGTEGDAQFDSRVMFGTSANPHWVIVPWETITQERAGIWLVQGGTSGIGSSETAGMFMDNANSTAANELYLRGMNGGAVNIAATLVAGNITSGTIAHSTGLYQIQGANGSFFASSVEFRGRLLAKDTPATTSAVNAHIATADGTIWKSSSASRFKIDPQEMELPDTILDVPIKDWLDRGMMEYQLSLDAEPRPHTETVATTLENISLDRISGVIAEEVAAAGGERFVTYGADGLIETVSYDRYALARTAVLKRQLDAATARIQALESKCLST